MDGAYYDRVFAWADQSRVPVEIHSYPRTHLPDDVCSPSRIRNVIRKYPALRVSVAHAGGFQYEELIGLVLYFNISAVLTDWAGQYGIEKTNHILRQLDVNRLVFATDYPDNRKLTPCEIYDRYFVILGSMGLAFGGAEIPRIHRVKHAHALTASLNYPLNIKSKGEHHGSRQTRRQRHPHAGAPAGKNLLDAGAFFLREAATAPCYRLWSINDNNPAMLRVDPADPQAVSVAVEVWQVPAAGLASVLMKEPEDLSVGKVTLSDGEVVLGVIGEPELVRGQKEISSYGGWRSYIASL